MGILLLAAPSGSGELETLVMPGPLIQGHAEIESDCGSCHRPFAPDAESGLCIECHEDIGTDIGGQSGFHGRAPGASGDCRNCHADHLGRAADIVGLDAALFVHDWTDYSLKGAHTSVPCVSCHPVGDKHRDAPLDCVGCHGSDDPHRERLGTQCADCHSELSWRRPSFDHATTSFPLEGAHFDAACSTCHANERWQDTPTDCGSCHAVDDVHLGRFGSDCSSCHGTVGWENLAFDHTRDTRFPLTGRHAKAACRSCHPQDLFETKTPTDCLSCHRNDDVHRNENGPRCGQCHGTASWVKLSFDHDRDTEFPLRAAHVATACTSCHTGDPRENPTPSDCLSCHRDEDAHEGQLGQKCQSCHGEASWQQDLRFDHELTSFPLLGLHATVACESCHETSRFQDAKTACVACHRADDAHEVRLGTSCGSCHNPNSWQTWRFDHGERTTFALHGSHEGVDCTSCHRASAAHPSALALPSGCVDCHASEDVHRGDFGTRCESCHSDAAWSRVVAPRQAREPRR